MKRILVILTVLTLATLACQATTLSAPTAATPSPQTTNNLAPDVMVAEPSFEDGSLIDLYRKSLPGVVALRVTTAQGSGVGSGFVFDLNGNIVTNLHVVEGATEVEVDFASGLKTYGTVIGTDPDSDLAVVSVDVPSEQLTPLPLGDSAQAARRGHPR